MEVVQTLVGDVPVDPVHSVELFLIIVRSRLVLPRTLLTGQPPLCHLKLFLALTVVIHWFLLSGE